MIFAPSEWIIHIQSCIVKMRKDLGYRDSLSAQTTRAHNALTNKLDGIHGILKPSAAGVGEQICNRYNITSSSSKPSATITLAALPKHRS